MSKRYCGNIKISSVEVIGVLVYWTLLLLTILMAVKAMGFSEADNIVREVIAIIPRVIVAVVVLILGLSFAGFISDVVQTAAVNAQIRQARMLANLSRYDIVVFVFVIALAQLQIATDIVADAIKILIASIGLALSLAFGLGCRDLAGKIATEYWEREKAASEALAAAAQSSGDSE